MKTLAIVVSHNDVNNTERTVASLIPQAEVVVWDNASTDRTVEILQRRFTQIKVHAHPDNVLWTPALNQATELYWDGEKNLLFSNNDIVYEPETVGRLEDAMQDRVGLAGPSGSGMGSAQDFAIWYGKNAPGWGHPMSDPLRAHIAKLPTVRAPNVVGAAMMVNPALRHEIGELDNEMPLGADDHDYCIRAREAGYSIWVVNSAHVHHKSHASYRRTKQVWKTYGAQSWDVFNKKWAGYFLNKEEAVKVQWGAKYYPGWDVGTGWLPLQEREEIWEMRKRLAASPHPVP